MYLAGGAEGYISVRDAGRLSELPGPQIGGNVWPEQCCPAFARRRIELCYAKRCWFCRYANFHLQERVALEVGVCCWPAEQMR